MRFPTTLPTPSNVGPILGSPVYASEYEALHEAVFNRVCILETLWHILMDKYFHYIHFCCFGE